MSEKTIPARIIKCACKNEWQDARYGSGMRVANRLKPVKDKPAQYRCTVCARVTP